MDNNSVSKKDFDNRTDSALQLLITTLGGLLVMTAVVFDFNLFAKIAVAVVGMYFIGFQGFIRGSHFERNK